METLDAHDVAAALRMCGLDAVPLDVLERAAIANALEKFGNNRTRAARSLGISVRTLQRKLKLWSPEPSLSTSASGNGPMEMDPTEMAPMTDGPAARSRLIQEARIGFRSATAASQ